MNKIEKKLWIHFAILIALVMFVILTCSNCAMSEKLLQCNDNDRLIIGYTKKKKRYKVLSGCGYKAQSVKIYGDTLKPGDYLIALDIYR